MSDKFRPLAEGYWVAPQIAPADVAAAAQMGVRLIVNNRPDNEEPGQIPGSAIAKAAEAAGLEYVAIPVVGASISAEQIDALEAALARAEGGVLAYCRSGTRSAVLRAFARARAGADVEALVVEAAEAGYDLSPLAGRLEAIARR